MRLPGAVLLLAAVGAGCTPTAALMTPPPSLSPPVDREGEVTGGVAFSAGGAGGHVAYGPWNVKGGGMDLAWAGGGAWAGTWNGAPARFVASQGRLDGPSSAVRIERRDGALAVSGTFAGRPVAVTIGRTTVSATLGTGACTLSLAAEEAGVLSGPVGCPGTGGTPASSGAGALRLEGEAILVPDVLLPQFVLALLAVLP